MNREVKKKLLRKLRKKKRLKKPFLFLRPKPE